MYSVGKAFLALLVLQLVDDGSLALDQPIADVWPEFGAGGKATATVGHLLTHRAGVPAIRERLTDDDLFDWERMTGAIAATEAWWVPGERFAYHVNTYGHLAGEVIRRATGQMPGARLRAVAGPLDADVWIGVPAAEQHRCADVVWAPVRPIAPVESFDGLDGDLLMNALAHVNPPGYSSIGVVNTPPWRSAQIGSTSGHMSASGVARTYAALLEPGRLLSPDLLREATRPQVVAHCPILDDEVTWGLGFQPTTPAAAARPQPERLRPLRHRWCPGVRRPGRRCRVRLRDEPRDPTLAVLAEPFAHRRGVRRPRSLVIGGVGRTVPPRSVLGSTDVDDTALRRRNP